MIYSLKSIFIIYIVSLSLVVQSNIIEHRPDSKDQIVEQQIQQMEIMEQKALGLNDFSSGPDSLRPPTISFDDKFKPFFPPFGSLVAPRVPEKKEPAGHGPLSGYTIKELQKLTLGEARKLKDKLIREQWSKKESHEANVRFMYLLDEAFYDVGIALDFIVRDIMGKIDFLSHHHIKPLETPNLFNIKSSAKDASEQILRRYLTLSELNFLKRYIDLSIKNILETDKGSP